MEYERVRSDWSEPQHNIYPSETLRYGVSDQDWNEAREELAHLGLSDSHHDLPVGTIQSYHQHQQHPTTHHQFSSTSNPYDENVNFNSTETDCCTPNSTWNPPSYHHLDSDDPLNYHHDTLQSSPSHNLTSDRWSSNPESSLLTSHYNADHSRYDEELPNLQSNTPSLEYDQLQYSNLDSNYLPTDPYQGHQELFDDSSLHQNNDQSHEFRSSRRHSGVEHDAAYDVGPQHDSYRDHSRHHLSQDDRDLRNSNPSYRRLNGGHSPRNFASGLHDSLGSTFNHSELSYELGASPSHNRSRGFESDLMNHDNGHHHHYQDRNDNYSRSPQRGAYLNSPSHARSSFLNDHPDPSLAYQEHLYNHNAADQFEGHRFSPHRAGYSSHEIDYHDDQTRRSTQSYSDDHLHFAHSPASTSRGNGYSHQFPDEIGGQIRSKVDRSSLEPLNELHLHQHSSESLRNSQRSYDVQRDEIERMRAQLDLATLNDIAPQLGSERSFPLSTEPMFSLSGRRSPHMSSLGADSSYDIPPPRSRTPFSVASGRRSPYSNLHRDSRTSSVLTPISGHRHTSHAMASHEDSLTHKLHEINDLTNEIRRSEQAHKRELAEINQTTSELVHQSLNDNLRQVDAAYQRELSLANQKAVVEQQSLVRDLRRNESAFQQDLTHADQRALSYLQPSMLQDAHEKEAFRELNQQRLQLDLQRSQLSHQQDRVDTQAQLSMIDRQLRAIDRQREIDSNRQLADLTRFGNLPSVLKGNYGGRALAPPYLQQSRILTAMRRWSDRDKSRHDPPIVYDHIDAYYSLMSAHLPKRLPMFQDPYYKYGLQSFDTGSKHRMELASSARLNRDLGMGNPFVDGIDYDYGFGRVGSLGLKHEQFAREQAYFLDDLYLYELLLRLDQSIDEVERQRRWRTRLGWEEWKDNRSRVQAWKRMSTRERKSLGLSEGSYWASNLFGIPLDSTFGYTNSLSSHRYRPNDLRSHYTLTPCLLSRYPMWKRGGLGLGRRLSNWYDSKRRPTYHTDLDRHSRSRRGYLERGLSTDSKFMSSNVTSGSYPSHRLSV